MVLLIAVGVMFTGLAAVAGIGVPGNHLIGRGAVTSAGQLAFMTGRSKMSPRSSRFAYGGNSAGLPECASQQVCNAMFMRLNRTQPLCACPGSFPRQCSTSLTVDEHTIKLISSNNRKAYNLVKVCEPVLSIRRCKAPQDWQLLALQSMRTGKSHYLIVCRCPTGSSLVGPIKHNNPPYANIPGIRVYGMLCVQGSRNSRNFDEGYPEVPWKTILEVISSTGLYHFW